MRRATYQQGERQGSQSFSIHALLAESDVAPVLAVGRTGFFCPRSPCGERHLDAWEPCHVRLFYPRSPCGERLGKIDARRSVKIFLSTLSLRRATKFWPIHQERQTFSIHALLAESDGIKPILGKIDAIFYPRSPCGERQAQSLKVAALCNFLSTLSLRRATVAPVLAVGRTGFFYPRSPCGERPSQTNLPGEN